MSSAASTRATEHILVVDDDPVVSALVTHVLERYGYRVTAATNGREALALIRDEPGHFDLVLSDIVMPEMDGTELYAELARNHPTLRFVFMSGYSDRSMPAAALRMLRKPFTTIGLLTLLGEALAH